MLFDILAGRSKSIIIGERWYRFRRGFGMTVSSADLARRNGYRIEYIRPATPEDIEYLEGNIGSEWSWLHNCVTVMAKPLDQRWEIAWRISIVVIAAAALGLGYLQYHNAQHETTRELIRSVCP